MKNYISQIEPLFNTDKLLQKEFSKSYLGKDIKKFILKSIKTIKVKNPKLVDLLILISNFTNAYSLARMFRTFKPSSTKPSEIQNAIFYAGDEHAKTIKAFIETVLKLKPIIEITAGDSCVDTKLMKKKSCLFQS